MQKLISISLVGLAFLLGPWGSGQAIAQPAQANQAQEPVVLYSYVFQYRSASDALNMVQSLISPRGSIELRPGENTLVFRDTAAALERLIPSVKALDRPVRPVDLEMLIVRAHRAAFSPIIPEDSLPDPLTEKLKEVLPFSSYKVVARTLLRSEEGEAVMYEMGEGFSVSFRVGSILPGDKIKLVGFRLAQAGAQGVPRRLVHSTLSLSRNRPMALGLAPNEASQKALVVVVTPSFQSLEGASPRSKP